MTERKNSQGALVKGGGSGSAGLGEIEAVFCTFGVRDYQGDVIMPWAISEGPVILSDWNHSSWESARPIGRGQVKVIGNQAKFVGRLFMDSEAGREAFHVLKGLDDLAQFSWSLDDIESNPGTDQHGRTVREITSVKIREVSPVLQAASIGTALTSIKGGGSSSRPLDRSTRADLARIREEVQRGELEAIRESLKQHQLGTEFRAALDEALAYIGVGYSQDAEWLVPAEVREAARDAIALYAPELGLDSTKIRIKWFSAEDDTAATVPGEFAEFYSLVPLLGKCNTAIDPNLLWLNSSLTEDDAWAVTSHELRHLVGGDEAEALLYESKARLERMGY
ncbi:hypothetical protein ABZ867_11930 [Streptomyces cinnamoneus]